MSASSSRQTRRNVFSNGPSEFVVVISNPGAGALPADRCRGVPGPASRIFGFANGARRASGRVRHRLRAIGHGRSLAAPPPVHGPIGPRWLLDGVAATFHAGEGRTLEDAGIVHRAALRRRPAVALAAIVLGRLGALAVARIEDRLGC